MGLWEKAASQFIDVIEWRDDTRETMVWKYPRGDAEIKNGAQLIVRESQAAAFLHEGELGDVFRPGRHELTTQNIPILTTLKSWKYAFNAPFKCDVFFVTTRQFTDLKWGTQNPIMLRDPEFGPIRLRAFGSYCVQVEDPGAFIRQLAGTDGLFETEEIVGQFRNMLVSRFADGLGESGIAALDLAANYDEVAAKLQDKLQAEFNEYGVKLTKFLVENISMPPEVEAAIDQKTKMNIFGNQMGAYTQMKTAEAIGDMAINPGTGGNMMGMVGGLNMGGAVAGAMSAAHAGAAQPAPAPAPAPQASQASQGAGAPPPLPTAAAWFCGFDGQQAGPFDGDALGQHAASGTLTRDTLVWKQGMGGWVPAGEVAELAGLFGAPPPLPG